MIQRIQLLKQIALKGMGTPLKLSLAQCASMLGTSIQTASRRLRELEEAGLIQCWGSPRSRQILITPSGIQLLRSEFQDYLKIFSSELGSKLVLTGKVISGLLEGGYYISQPEYMQQFREKLGFCPYPGTLNVELTRESIPLRYQLDSQPGIKIQGFIREGRSFGGCKCFRASLDGIQAAVVIPERTHHRPEILEIISALNLRQELGLRDGDRIQLEVAL